MPSLFDQLSRKDFRKQFLKIERKRAILNATLFAEQYEYPITYFREEKPMPATTTKKKAPKKVAKKKAADKCGFAELEPLDKSLEVAETLANHLEIDSQQILQLPTEQALNDVVKLMVQKSPDDEFIEFQNQHPEAAEYIDALCLRHAYSTETNCILDIVAALRH